MRIQQKFSELIELAKKFGLPSQDIENSKEMLKYNEYVLCLDILLTQLYEFNVKVDNYFYELYINISNKLKIDSEKYSFIKELIG